MPTVPCKVTQWIRIFWITSTQIWPSSLIISMDKRARVRLQYSAPVLLEARVVWIRHMLLQLMWHLKVQATEPPSIILSRGPMSRMIRLLKEEVARVPPAPRNIPLRESNLIWTSEQPLWRELVFLYIELRTCRIASKGPKKLKPMTISRMQLQDKVRHSKRPMRRKGNPWVLDRATRGED